MVYRRAFLVKETSPIFSIHVHALAKYELTTSDTKTIKYDNMLNGRVKMTTVS